MKYFCVSDLHSFYDEFISALTTAGYDKNNPEHTLIVLGDIFDRGFGTKDIYKFLASIPDNRLILIRGNHEDLFVELLAKSFPDRHDFSNGTVRSFCQLANKPADFLDISSVICLNPTLSDTEIWKLLKSNWNSVKASVRRCAATRMIKTGKWLNYFEVGPFIFTHSFLPTVLDPYFSAVEMGLVENWRTAATQVDWEHARWGSPITKFQNKLFDAEIANDKILVCGHWHTVDFHRVFENDFSDNYEIYFGSNLIALDACTALTGNVNVLIIDENYKCFDKYGNELKIK